MLSNDRRMRNTSFIPGAGLRFYFCFFDQLSPLPHHSFLCFASSDDILYTRLTYLASAINPTYRLIYRTHHHRKPNQDSSKSKTTIQIQPAPRLNTSTTEPTFNHRPARSAQNPVCSTSTPSQPRTDTIYAIPLCLLLATSFRSVETL